MPWHNKIGKEAARLAASCDASIRDFKVLQSKSLKTLIFHYRQSGLRCVCSVPIDDRVQNLEHGSQPLRLTTALRLTKYWFLFPNCPNTRQVAE